MEKALVWIDSFLCNRQQSVVVNGAKSQWAPVLSGVSQGTVLGPLLYSLYINNIKAGIESVCLLITVSAIVRNTSTLRKDIDQMGKWARKWGMRFQPVKCNIIMQLTRKRIKTISAVYSLEGTVLENVDNIKYLGVTISTDLKWNTHASNVCTKANRTNRNDIQGVGATNPGVC